MQLCSYSVTADIDDMQINMQGCVPIKLLKTSSVETFLGAQPLKIHVSTARGTGSILGQGSKILHAAKKKKKPKHLGEPLLKPGILLSASTGTLSFESHKIPLRWEIKSPFYRV